MSRRTVIYRENYFRRQYLFLLFFQNFKSLKKQRAIQLILISISSMVITAPNGFASQSTFQQRSSFNSEQQINLFLGGSWGFDEKAFLNGSFSHARTPVAGLANTDTFYQGTLGAGYTVDTIGFDAGIILSKAPVTKTSSFGGYVGLTYIYIPQNVDPSEYSEQSLDLLRNQSYAKITQKEDSPAIFWTRLGYNANTMKSTLLDSENDKGQESSFNLELFVPVSQEIVIGLGGAIHSYNNDKGFFSSTLKNTTNSNLQLLGATLQGLPHASISTNLSWKITARDSFLPRYQATEIESSRTWSHTIDLGWRHQLSKNFYIAPTYEASTQNSRTLTGIILDLLFSW